MSANTPEPLEMDWDGYDDLHSPSNDSPWDDQPSTASEWDHADARQRGEENPEAAWVLTDRDVWHPNPFYRGPPMPHPEQ